MKRLIPAALLLSSALAAPALAQDQNLVDPSGERVNQLIVYGDDPCPPSTDGTITVSAIGEATVEAKASGDVKIVPAEDGEDGATGFIKRSDLGRDRDEQRPDRFQVGSKIDAMVIGFDRSKKPNFSIKARQIAEEKEAVAQFGSQDSGASLGDILGAAIRRRREMTGEE